MKKSSPARIYVYLASKSDEAVIIRRGPSRLVQLIRWERAKDKFYTGQWLKGRVFERDCDISPSGKYFAYGARSFRDGQEKQYNAVSRPPYLTALAFWDVGVHSGAIVFAGERKVWLQNSQLSLNLPQTFYVDKNAKQKPASSLYDYRMERDGWKLEQKPETRRKTISTKVTQSNYSIVMTLLGFGQKNGPYKAYNYQLRDNEDKIVIDLKNAEWADWDHNGDLLFAREGKLWRLKAAQQEPIYTETSLAIELIDLNDSTFEEVRAPVWAKKW
ncbi:MAG: hypothetical protein KA392_13225 [Candidatus Obscuribacter sp.]|nr:hypothetical protein [Candidatus Obscuribacter sp.]MBP6591667.1 hypothetical protein [Candidatus Obscuribacter sp.]